MFKFLTKKTKTDSDFSNFVRSASSREKKKVFKRVINKSIEDQRKILGY